MLNTAETWAMKVDTLKHLQRNDCAMTCWISNVRAKDEFSSDYLLLNLGIQDFNVMLRKRVQHRLDCRSTHAECGCTEKTWQVMKCL